MVRRFLRDLEGQRALRRIPSAADKRYVYSILVKEVSSLNFRSSFVQVPVISWNQKKKEKKKNQ